MNTIKTLCEYAAGGIAVAGAFYIISFLAYAFTNL